MEAAASWKEEMEEAELVATLGDFTLKENCDRFFTIRPFEWYADWPSLRSALFPHLPCHPSTTTNILIPGCGNSRLSQFVNDAGSTSITNIDFSQVVVADMFRGLIIKMAPARQDAKQNRGREIFTKAAEEDPTRMVSEPSEGGTIPSPISDELSQIRQVQDHLISTMADLSNKFDLLLKSRLEDAGNCGNLDNREGIGTSHARSPMYGVDLGEHMQGNQRGRQQEGQEGFAGGRTHQERPRSEVPISSAWGRLQSYMDGLQAAIGN